MLNTELEIKKEISKGLEFEILQDLLSKGSYLPIGINASEIIEHFANYQICLITDDDDKTILILEHIDLELCKLLYRYHNDLKRLEADKAITENKIKSLKRLLPIDFEVMQDLQNIKNQSMEF